MLSPGEQPRGGDISVERIVLVLVACALLCVPLFLQRDKLNEYRLYLSEPRQPAVFGLAELSEDWTENTLRQRFAGNTVRCAPHGGDSTGAARVCAVDVKAYNGVPAMFVSFFFAKARLDQVSINIPWWVHGEAEQHLRATLGPPVAAQLLPRAGVRLYGWQLDQGGAVFFNRERDWNPLVWNAIYWRSASACRSQACFELKRR